MGFVKLPRAPHTTHMALHEAIILMPTLNLNP